MTDEIKGPDGMMYKFPKGTSDEEVLAFFGGAEAVTQEPDSFLSKAGKAADDVVRSIASGMTFGFADEIAAAGNAALTDQTYEEAHKAEMERDASIHPGIAIPGEIIGGVVTGGVGAAKALGTQAVKNAPKLLRMAAYPGVGAVEGAVAGAGHAKPGDRVKGATIGAGMGAVTGAVLPAAARGGRAVINKIKDIKSPPGQAAASRVYKALVRDGLTPEQAIAKIREMGPDAALIDVGRNTSGLGEAIASRPGKALSDAGEFFEQRKAGQFDRVMATLDDAAPPARSVLEVEKTPDFVNSLEIHAELTPKLRKLLNRPTIRNAWDNAKRLAGESDMELPDIDKIIDDGSVVGVETRLLHWLKKGMDDILEVKRDTVSGKVDAQFGRNALESMKKTRAEFRTLIKELNPDYAKQIDRIAAAKQIEEGIERGKDFFGRKMDPTAIQTVMKRFSPEQKEAYQREVLRQIETRIVPRAELGYDVSRDIIRLRPKLRAVFGDETADKIVAKMRQERSFSDTGNRVLSNSRTSFRDAAKQDFDDGGLGAAVDVATGTPINAVQRGARALGHVLMRPSEKIADEVAPMLYATDAAKQQQILGELLRQGQKATAGNARAQAISGALIGGSSQVKPVSP